MPGYVTAQRGSFIDNIDHPLTSPHPFSTHRSDIPKNFTSRDDINQNTNDEATTMSSVNEHIHGPPPRLC
jgi:hypothetical protein